MTFKVFLLSILIVLVTLGHNAAAADIEFKGYSIAVESDWQVLTGASTL